MRRTGLIGLFLLAAALLAVFVLMRADGPEPASPFRRWTRVAALSSAPQGLDWPEAETVDGLTEALEGNDPARLGRLLRDAELQGLFVPLVPDESLSADSALRAQLSAGVSPPGLRGALLSSPGLLYVIDETEWPAPLAQKVLGRVARGILEGDPAPSIDRFPVELSRTQPVEVMVLLRDRKGVRLWRSARGGSIAEALVTAAAAARERWTERTEAMGGPLENRLDALDVEVSLLIDDGTFVEPSETLIDALVLPSHGVAFDQTSRWRYELPSMTQRAGRPSAAFAALFEQNDLPANSFTREDLRLYRLRVEPLSVDQGSETGSSRGETPAAAALPSSSGAGSEDSSISGDGGTPGNSTTKVVPAP